MDEIHGKKWDKNTALKGLNNELIQLSTDLISFGFSYKRKSKNSHSLFAIKDMIQPFQG